MARPPTFGPRPRYFPLARGTYEVTAGLRPLGTDFGNGPMDGRVFQIDDEWPRFRANKVACRAERVGKYLARADLDDGAAAALVEWFAGRLVVEYPAWFGRHGDRLWCQPSGETVALDGDPFAAFDAVAMQVQEDVCLTRAEGGRDWLAAGHVCSPGHWGIEAKIGLPFAAVHGPVPGIEPVNRAAGALVRLMIDRGPFVRFAWGFGTDDRLNHHPDPPPGVPADAWQGRRFTPGEPRLVLRVERQVMWGLPAVGAAVFTIRVSHLDGDAIRADPARRDQLRAALASMSPAAVAYKGLGESLPAVLDWLDARA